MALHCHHGVESTRCSTCPNEKHLREGSLYVDDGAIEIRLRDKCPEWMVWHYTPGFYSHLEVDHDMREVVLDTMAVIPRSPDVFPNVDLAVSAKTPIYFAVDESPCWVFSSVMNVRKLPVIVHVGLDNCVFGDITIFVDGQMGDTKNVARYEDKYIIKESCRMALRFHVYGSPCIARFIITCT